MTHWSILWQMKNARSFYYFRHPGVNLPTELWHVTVFLCASIRKFLKSFLLEEIYSSRRCVPLRTAGLLQFPITTNKPDKLFNHSFLRSGFLDCGPQSYWNILRGAMGGISGILVKNHCLILLNKFNLHTIIFNSLKFQTSITAVKTFIRPYVNFCAI